MKNERKKRAAVVTGTRAEYGILKPLISKIDKSKSLELKLIVTGVHLLEKYGRTINEIKKDKFNISAIVKIYSERGEIEEYYGRAFSTGVVEFTKLFTKMKPSILIVFGDRIEPLAATLAAAMLRIPVAHIEGGDKTDSGHIDESMRHSISRFAHLHFPASQESTKRLIRMGEEPWRIKNVGALGVDSMLQEPIIKKETIMKKLRFDIEKPFVVCLFHSVPLEKEQSGKHMHEILEALKKLQLQTVLIYPNNDLGNRAIIGEIRKYENLPFFRTFKTIPHKEYVNTLRYTDAMVGNSSSGIVEAPSFGLPVVNVGPRNVGREHAENVIFAKANKKMMIQAIKKALYDKKFRKKAKRCKTPYGKGKASDRIVKTLTKIKLDKRLLQKKITY